MKYLVVGHGAHGKSVYGERLAIRLGVDWRDSSMFAAGKCVRSLLANLGVHYDSIEECHADRRNYRDVWFRAISSYNAADPTKLATELYKEASIYVGMRSEREFRATVKKHHPFTIFIDARERLEYRDPSLEITPDMCDLHVKNNGTFDELIGKADRLAETIRGRT